MDNLSFKEVRAAILLCAYHCDHEAHQSPNFLEYPANTLGGGRYDFSLCSPHFREHALKNIIDCAYLFTIVEDPRNEAKRKHLMTLKGILRVESFIDKCFYIFPFANITDGVEHEHTRVIAASEFVEKIDLEMFDKHFELDL